MKHKKGLALSEQSKSKGFTLIELLVAISIVAVLATIGLTLFQTTQATARDGRRRADINAIATTLETRFDATTGNYPIVLDLWFADKLKPKDPLDVTNADPAKDYRYYGVPAAVATTYAVCAHLEKGGGNFTDKGITAGSGNYYCKLNQQQ